MLEPKLTCLFDHTDGCSCQYHSCTALYFLTLLSSQFHISIDQFIHCPAHGKGIVDRRNVLNKRYLCDCMRRAGKADSEDFTNRFRPWSHTDSKQTFFSEEAVRLCSHPNRKDGLQGAGDKYKKRIDEKK